MIHISEHKVKGMTISIEVASPTQKVVLEALLNSARICYSSFQKDNRYVHYQIEPGDVNRIKGLINGWRQTIDDLQYAVDTRTYIS